jgi:D-glycero-D-manno-heptose 1,7-bisphosphate phosphatase
MNESQTAEKRVVILDRDGTVVVDRHYLSEPAGLELLPGAAEGLRQLYERGHKLVVITNQSGVGRGLLSLQRLDEIHDRLREMVSAVGARLAEVYFCPHLPEDDCTCRKPRLGLLTRAASELGFNPANTIVIGDKLSDVEFGRRAGATTILIAAEQDATYGEHAPHFVAADLAGAAKTIEALESETMDGRQRG